MRPILALCVAFGLGLPAFGAEPTAPAPEVAPEPGDIPPEEWRALVRGQTLHYRINGEHWALEQYAPSGNGVVLQLLQSGECLTGTWAYDSGQYCFSWDSGETSCFRHTRVAGQIVVIHMVDGSPTGGVQTMDLAGEVPLTCAGQYTS
ncbi:MAG: hypothetical protein AAFR93_01755 [Pseudomonadota bacterium]